MMLRRWLATIVGVMMVPRGGRVIVMHLLLSRLVRFLQEVLAEKRRAVSRLELVHD